MSIFASDVAALAGKTARVPSPGPALEPRLVAEARGAADSPRSGLRYHDARLHARVAPIDVGRARRVRRARDRAGRGARRARDGRRSREPRASHRARVRGDAIVRARTAEEVPLATAVALIARERLTGEAPPRPPLPGLKLVAPWIEEKAAAELDALALTLDDQAAFAKLSRRLARGSRSRRRPKSRSRKSRRRAATTRKAMQGGSDDKCRAGR